MIPLYNIWSSYHEKSSRFCNNFQCTYYNKFQFQTLDTLWQLKTLIFIKLGIKSKRFNSESCYWIQFTTIYLRYKSPIIFFFKFTSKSSHWWKKNAKWLPLITNSKYNTEESRKKEKDYFILQWHFTVLYVLHFEIHNFDSIQNPQL